MAYIKGELQDRNYRIGIVVSRWNQDITFALERGSRRALIAFGCSDERIDTIEVPGAFEIPVVLDALGRTGKYHALIALGCVIKGETTHFEHVSEAAMRGIYEIGLKHCLPIGCGVLTTYTSEQATARAQDDDENKGSEAALAVLETLSVLQSIKDQIR
jgi:6,7-dimethyl-8-ribityllumazine synthase